MTATPAQNPDNPNGANANAGMTFDSEPVKAPDAGMTFDSEPVKAPEVKGTIAVPSAGHIPGVSFSGEKVTPGQAAGGIVGGAAIGAAPFVPSAVSVAAPLVARATEYLSHLDNIVKVAKTLGYTTFGIEQAHKLYQWVSGEEGKKTTNGQASE
jgi:hypothetical protein